MKIAVALVLANSAVVTQSQPWDWGDDTEWAQYDETKAVCRALRNREPPASDRPTREQARALQGCDSQALYYGIGMPPDPIRARQCAFLEAEPSDDLVFGGRPMLMTIYANGIGAARDLDVAIHLACGYQGAPAEVDGRIRHLVELRDTGWTGNDFHVCDDITSGFMMGHCAGQEAARNDVRRAAILERTTRGWSEADRRAFASLQRALEAYVSSRNLEIDMSGTMRGALQVGAEEVVKDEFVRTIDQLEGGAAPRFDHAQFEAADAELNRAYREAMRGEFSDCPGCVTADGIRDAQRAWLRYRDAFLAFAAVHYPQVSRDSLAAWLTQQRTALLRPEPE